MMIANLWHHRELIAQLTGREVERRFKGSVLGVLWTLLEPLATLAVYTLVFTVIFEPRFGTASRTEYAVRLFCGIIVFGILAETLAQAPTLVVSKPNFVRKVVFPLEVLPVVTLCASLVSFLGGLLILVAGIVAVLHTLPPTIVLLPLTLLPLLLLTLGLAWFLASLGVYLRDTPHVVRVLLRIGFFLTPIVWTIDFVPERWRTLARLNPVAPVIEAARATAIEGRWPEWSWLAVATGVSLVIFAAGYTWFVRTRRGFADVV